MLCELLRPLYCLNRNPKFLSGRKIAIGTVRIASVISPADIFIPIFSTHCLTAVSFSWGRALCRVKSRPDKNCMPSVISVSVSACDIDSGSGFWSRALIVKRGSIFYVFGAFAGITAWAKAHSTWLGSCLRRYICWIPAYCMQGFGIRIWASDK